MSVAPEQGHAHAPVSLHSLDHLDQLADQRQGILPASVVLDKARKRGAIYANLWGISDVHLRCHGACSIRV